MSNGEEGIGNAVVIGLIQSTQGLYLSPEGLRYIIVLFYQDKIPSIRGRSVETTAQPRFWSNADSGTPLKIRLDEASRVELTDGSVWKTGTLQSKS